MKLHQQMKLAAVFDGDRLSCPTDHCNKLSDTSNCSWGGVVSLLYESLSGAVTDYAVP